MSTPLKDNKKILIVDDEPEICEVVSEILQPHFTSITCIGDSELASKSILTENYDLIISDISMPNMSGSELIRYSRSQGILTPIIFLTGHATKETLLAGMRLGVADVIEKPFESDVLISSARRIIEIEKRRADWILTRNDKLLTPEQIEKKRKMIGLFLVSTEKLKIG